MLHSNSKEGSTIDPEQTICSTNSSKDEETTPDISESDGEENILTTRSGRVIKTPTRLNDYICIANGMPNTYEALNSTEWRSAMDNEMKTLSENDVFEVVDRPRNKKIVGNRWVFREKNTV